MDGLSAAASVIAVIQISAEVVKYINSAAGATKQRKLLREELRACEDTIHQLKDEVDDDESEKGAAWSATISALEAPGGSLGRLAVALQAIKAKLVPTNEASRMEKALFKLKWPFTEKEVQEIVGLIEREKALLSLALANNSRRLIQELSTNARENQLQLVNILDMLKESSVENHHELVGIKDQIVAVRSKVDNEESTRLRRTILDWLVPGSFAAQYTDFISRKQEGTGEWFLDSPQFKKWLEGNGSSLFCPGIPGAGKTMVASLVIEHLLNKVQGQEQDAQIGVAFIYCNFRRQEEQTPLNLVSNLLKQLVRGLRKLPDTLVSLHQAKEGTQTRPSYQEILQVLRQVIGHFSAVFVVVDALDECQITGGNRTILLTDLLNLQTSHQANIMVTSRFIPDIEETFRDSPSLEVRASESDIGRYVEGFLPQLPLFVGRDLSLQEDIRKNITDAVSGM